MPFDLKIRLIRIRKRQTDLYEELKKNGLKVFTSELSAAINGKLVSPKADKILSLSNEIVTEWENESNRT